MIDGITFDDILLIPNYSDILPNDVFLSTRLTKNIKLEIPIISADMDTVTEHKMAIAMALEGGIGIIHKNLSPQKQAEEIDKTKRFKNGFIRKPIVLRPDDLIKKAIEIREKFGYKSIPVTDSNDILIGFLASKDYCLIHKNLPIKSRMTPYENLLVVEEKITIEEAYKILIENRASKLFVVNNKKERKLISLVAKTDLEKNENFPHSVKDKENRLLVGAAVAPSKDLEERLKFLISAGVDVIVVSTAHGHSQNVIEVIKYIKENYSIDVIAGNVATSEGAEELIKAGADAIKVGMGPGSICTTRIVTGVGVPQVTAIMSCFEIAKKYNVPLIADGGIRYSGDIAKALAMGAETVMLGNLLAGVEESPSEVVIYKGKKYKAYRGMGSEGALKSGGQERYGFDEKDKIISQGIEGQVTYEGKLNDKIYQLCGGVRAAFSFLGAKDIKTFQERAKFIKVSLAGKIENHPHDVFITKETSNYTALFNS